VQEANEVDETIKTSFRALPKRSLKEGCGRDL